MHKPGIPAQQMQRTGTHERVCRSGTGENPLAEHAHHDPQPCSIAWGGGGEAAMKGSAPCARESCWSRSQQELRCRYFFTGTEYGVRNRLPKSRPTDPTHPGEHSHMLAEPMEQKNPSPCGRRPVGNAPPRRGRMGEMDTSRKRSPPLAGKGKIQVSELVSHTACAHPLGVAERMRLVRCEVPPSMPACGAYLLCPPVAVRL